MTSMKTAVVHNQSGRGLFIGKEYVAANGLGRVDLENEFLQELIKRGTVTVVDSPDKRAEKASDAEVAPASTEAVTPSDDTSEDSAPVESASNQEDATSVVTPRRISSSKTNRS